MKGEKIMADKVIETKENEYYVKFNKIFKWEDKDYEGVDLSGLEALTGRQYCDAVKKFNTGGNMDVIVQQNPQFAAIVASMVTSLPIEFFYDLPARELNAVKNRVGSYFFGQD